MSIMQILQDNKTIIKERYPVKSIGIFGSFIRGEANQKSDVDILVEFEKPVDIFEFIDLKEYLEVLLQKEVDLISVKALKPQLKECILQEVVYV